MKEKDWKRFTGRLLIGFLVIMAAGTVVSHAADSFLVARVLTAQPGGKSLTISYQGSGELVAEREQGIYPPAGLIVEELLVQQGEEIEEGTPLLRYETGSLQEALQEKETAYKTQRLSVQELLSDNGTESITEEIKAAEEALADAREAAEEARDNLIELQKDSEKELRAAKTEELAAAEEAQEEALWQQEEGIREAAEASAKAGETLRRLEEEWDAVQKKITAYIDLLNDSKSKQTDRNKLLAELETILYGGSEAYQNHLDEVTNQALAGNTIQLAQLTRKETLLRNELKAYAKASQSYAEAMEEGAEEEKLGELSDECAERLTAVLTALYTKEGMEEKKEALQTAEKAEEEALRQEERIRERLARTVSKAEEKRNKLVQLLESIENGTYDYEKELESGKKAVKEAEKAVRRAEEDVAEAKAKTPEDSTLKQERTALAKEMLAQLEEEKEVLQTLVQAEGIYCSELSGTVVQCSLTAGMTYGGGQSAFRIGTGSQTFVAYLEKEAKGQVEVGDLFELRFAGKSKAVEATIIALGEETREGSEVLKLTAELPEEGADVKQSQADYTVKKRSDYYEMCIPLTALREDSISKFVYVLRERERILGKELYVVRIDVTLLEKDAASAAVTGMLNERDEVIISASRTLSEGDRVRRKE